MKRFLIVIAVSSTFLNSCKSNQNIDKNCFTVTDISTSSECYSQSVGLTLTTNNIPESIS